MARRTTGNRAEDNKNTVSIWGRIFTWVGGGGSLTRLLIFSDTDIERFDNSRTRCYLFDQVAGTGRLEGAAGGGGGGTGAAGATAATIPTAAALIAAGARTTAGGRIAGIDAGAARRAAAAAAIVIIVVLVLLLMLLRRREKRAERQGLSLLRVLLVVVDVEVGSAGPRQELELRLVLPHATSIGIARESPQPLDCQLHRTLFRGFSLSALRKLACCLNGLCYF